MVEGILNKIILWGVLILFILAIIFIFYSPAKGFMGKLGRLALGAERFLPVETQKETGKKQNQQVPQETIDAQQEFANTIKNMLSRQTNNQFCQTDVELTRLKDYELQLSQNDGLNIRITKKLKEGNTYVNNIKIDNAKICVLDSSKVFNCNILKKQQCNQQDYYEQANFVNIASEKITANGKTTPMANTLIRIGQTNNICFVRTISPVPGMQECNPEYNIIDETCLAYLKKNNIMPSC